MLTVPNAISVVRLLCVPLFLWLLFGAKERTAAFCCSAGWARPTGSTAGSLAASTRGASSGKILDPVADRILLLTAAIALMIDGAVPVWVGVLVLVREAIVSVATLALAAAGAARIDVQWVGKAGTLALMFALPGFLLIDSIGSWHGPRPGGVGAWLFTAGGLVLGYFAAAVPPVGPSRAARGPSAATPRRRRGAP